MKIGFECANCHKWMPINKQVGTANRNHCPFCLWSKHLDQYIPGDRKSSCLALMEPVGLTFKGEGNDKYGNPKQGELMLIHKCLKGDKISINRLASDDDPEAILQIFHFSTLLDKDIKEELTNAQINLLTEKDEPEIKKQLYGILTKS